MLRRLRMFAACTLACVPAVAEIYELPPEGYDVVGAVDGVVAIAFEIFDPRILEHAAFVATL